MQLSKVTYALVAAGLVGGVATFYNQVNPSPRSRRHSRPPSLRRSSRPPPPTCPTSPRSRIAQVPPS